MSTEKCGLVSGVHRNVSCGAVTAVEVVKSCDGVTHDVGVDVEAVELKLS